MTANEMLENFYEYLSDPLRIPVASVCKRGRQVRLFAFVRDGNLMGTVEENTETESGFETYPFEDAVREYHSRTT